MKHAVIVFFVLALFPVVACSGIFSHDVSYRYRITVKVQTPEGIKTGAAVRQVTTRFSASTSMYPWVTGEAVVVDLGKRGVLFALKGDDAGYQILWKALPCPKGAPRSTACETFYSQLKNAKAVITSGYPIFVHFRNLNDPMTAEAVYPVKDKTVKNALGGGPERDFEDIFGKGVGLDEVSIEMTDDPVTWTIEKWLPWLEPLKGAYLNGEHHSRGAPLGLHAGYFQTREREYYLKK